jgi:hypothetical protein
MKQKRDGQTLNPVILRDAPKQKRQANYGSSYLEMMQNKRDRQTVEL